MGLKLYVFLLFGISIALYFVGYKPLLFSILQCDTAATVCVPSTNFATQVLNTFLQLFSNPFFFVGTALAIFVPFVVGGSFNVYYLIPFILLTALSNFLILPSDFLIQTALPVEIKMIVLGFLNLLLLLTAIQFIRGGD